MRFAACPKPTDRCGFPRVAAPLATFALWRARRHRWQHWSRWAPRAQRGRTRCDPWRSPRAAAEWRKADDPAGEYWKRPYPSRTLGPRRAPRRVKFVLPGRGFRRQGRAVSSLRSDDEPSRELQVTSLTALFGPAANRLVDAFEAGDDFFRRLGLRGRFVRDLGDRPWGSSPAIIRRVPEEYFADKPSAHPRRRNQQC